MVQLYSHIVSSGDGGIQCYLDKIGKARFSDYVFCNGLMNDGDYRFFLVKGGVRLQLYADTGELSSDNIAREILTNTAKLSRSAHYVRVLILTKKVDFGRQRDHMPGVPSN